MNALDHISACDNYLNERTGKYAWRRVRYLAALEALREHGLDDSDTVIDVGAGWTEFSICLRCDGGSHARYFPVDGCLDGTNLEVWTPPRNAEFFVALELLEHLSDPERLVINLQDRCEKALVISTPNPGTTDVLGMDATHKTPISEYMLKSWGFQEVDTASFYGQEEDSIFAVWHPSQT
jgi:hypothetical protein